MNRRGFLGLIGGLAAGAIADPEKLLWEPGRKLISLPPARPVLTFNVGDVFTIAGRFAVNPRTSKIAAFRDPVTGEFQPILQRFVVTQSGFTTNPLSIPRWPPEIERGQFTNLIIDLKIAPAVNHLEHFTAPPVVAA